MALQLRIGLALAAGAAGFHSYWVWDQRRRYAPTGRLLQFAPGSSDDQIARLLKTGDLVLFSRECTLYSGLDGLNCAARKQLAGTPYDHVGVIVLVHGEPHVLERTYSGVKLRRFDARVRTSKSKKIVLRMLDKRLPPEAERAALAFASAQAASSESRTDLPYFTGGGGLPFGAALKEFSSMALRSTKYNSSVELVQAFYDHLGLLPPAGAAASAGATTSAPSHVPCVAPFLSPSQPLAKPYKLHAPLWMRDLV